MQELWLILRPNRAKLIIFAVLILLSTLLLQQNNPTSKVTWDKDLGTPLAFLSLDLYLGLCSPFNFCRDTYIQAFYPAALLFDVLFWYVIACVLYMASTRALHRVRDAPARSS